MNQPPHMTESDMLYQLVLAALPGVIMATKMTDPGSYDNVASRTLKIAAATLNAMRRAAGQEPREEKSTE